MGNGFDEESVALARLSYLSLCLSETTICHKALNYRTALAFKAGRNFSE
jgi:hypothetical protein